MITDKEIRQLWSQAHNEVSGEIGVIPDHRIVIPAFARLIEQRAREEEREACARVCEDEAAAWGRYEIGHVFSAVKSCARAIRARGES